MAEQGHSNEQKRPYDDVEYGQYDNDADYLTPIYDEGVAPLLPKHTRVQVIGNNRTQKKYVGLHAVVKRAVGLGGWHWLVLPSGDEIKLQRNALLVLEYPTGAESEFSEDLEPPAPAPPNNSEASPAAPPRRREPSPGGYSPDRQPTLHEELVLAQKTQDRKLSLRRTAAGPRINLSRLSIETLRRYRTVYQLPDAGPNATREQLLDAVARHFSSIQVDEMSVIRHFLAAVRRQGQEQDGSGR